MALSLASSPSGQARPVHIIHTNDLHSHFDHAEDPARGGYPDVRRVIHELKERSEAAGIPTLVMDAGDFTEGSLQYFADRGRSVWRVMNQMGFDAVVMGNHDWLMGPEDFDELLADTPPAFDLLGANFLASKRRTQIKKHVRRHATYERGGLRISVIGLTTPEFVFNWRAEEGMIGSHVDAAFKALGEVRGQSDAVIALTHLGVKTDRALIERVSGIDAVVGGHSHTELHEPIFVQDKKRKRLVPIVQTGKHGETVGSFLVDIEPGRPLRVLRYELVPVLREAGREPAASESASTTELHRLIRENRALLERDYGREWLTEKLGESKVPLGRPGPDNEPTAWTRLVTDSLREAARADVALDIDEFNGPTQPAGAITRETLMKLYPRQFEFSQKLGWTIWTHEVSGWILKLAVEQAVKLDAGFRVSGATWKVKLDSSGNRQAADIRIGGEKIRAFKSYRLAVPEGIGRGSVEIFTSFRLLLRQPEDTRIPVWTAIENRLRKLGTID